MVDFPVCHVRFFWGIYITILGMQVASPNAVNGRNPAPVDVVDIPEMS